MLVKLKSVGAFDQSADTPPAEGVRHAFADRRAMLVYAGDFLSVEGPVTVTPAHISLIHDTHNSAFNQLKRLAAAVSPLALKHCPPIQLDHSTSARDTVGRLIGNIEIADYVAEDGAAVPALFGTVRILGAENVERVDDGRWTHLSIGADLETGRLMELSITPFPAAANAALLSRLAKTRVCCETADGQPDIVVNHFAASNTFEVLCGSTVLHPGASSEAEARVIVARHKLTLERDRMNLAKLMAFLTGKSKMSNEDAEKKLAEMDDEAKLKLAAEADAEEAEEEKKKKEKEDEAKLAGETRRTNLAAAREKLTTLSTGFTGLAKTARLQARQGSILTRLSALRSNAKITPAEIKKLDIAALAAADDAALKLVFQTYEQRQPVIHIGQRGSSREVNLAAAIQAEKTARLEADVRANLSLSRKKTNLSGEENPGGDMPGGVPAGAGMLDNDPAEDTAFFEREYTEICRLIDEGKAEELKTRLKGWMQKLAALGGASAESAETNALETEAQLSALSEGLTKMEAEYGNLLTVAQSLAAADA